MNKVFRFGETLLACLLAAALCMGSALAKAPAVGLVLVGDLPKDAELAENKSDAEGNSLQVWITGDGAISIATLRQKVNEVYPLEMPLEDFRRKYFGLEEMAGLQAVEAKPVAAYPAERVRFEIGENEDASIEDVTVIRTDEYYFAFVAHTSADVYYGYSDGYEGGDAAEMIDDWVASLDLFDSGETLE